MDTIATPFFSVVVPVYNVELYLESCIESILRQTCEDYEIILIDDGSKDSSLIICNRYKDLYPSVVRVFHKKNEGLLLTRLYGVEKSKGEYILSLDSDDELRYDALELLKNAIQTHNADMIIFSASRKNDFSNRWNEILLDSDKILEIHEMHRLICSGSKLNNLVLKVFKRRDYPEREKIEPYKYVKNGEDLIQSLYIIDNVKKWVYLSEILYYYRVNQESITNTFQKNYFESISSIGTVLRTYAIKWDIGDNELINMVYQRNVISCVRTIKEVIKLCDSYYLRNQTLEDICNSQFLKSSLRLADLKNIHFLDRYLIKMCIEKRYVYLAIISKLIRIYNGNLRFKKVMNKEKNCE